MLNPPQIARTIRFRDLELDRARRELRRAGTALLIEPRVFDLLEYLVRHRDRRVLKRELLDQLWPEADVAEGALASAITRLRRILGDDRGLIQTRYREGYQFVGDCELAGEAPPVGEALTAPPVFVGRNAELEQLTAVVHRTLQGSGTIVVVSGEQGIGKSRLVEECVSRCAAVSDALIGRCHEGDATPPFWPWVQLLRAFAFTTDAATLDRVVRASGSAIASLIPDVATILGSRRAVGGDDGASSRQELFRAVVAFLRAAGARRPLLIAIEDLHWADPASLSLLRFVASHVAALPVVLLVTSRPATSEASPLLLSSLECLRGLDRSVDLVLPGLSEGGAAELIEGLGRSLDAGVRAEILDGAHGNPLFLELLTRHFTDGRSPTRQALPSTLQLVLEQRLASVSSICRHVLAVAAVAGMQFDLPLARSVVAREMGELPRSIARQVAGALVEAMDARIIERVSEDGARYRFAHALWREALYRGQGAAERIRRHQRTGEVLERRPEVDAAEVAEHYLIGSTGAPTAKAVEWLRRAGEAAAAQFAFETAEQRFQQALSLAAFLDRFPRAAEGRLLTRLAWAQWRLGTLTVARASVERAVAVARERRDGTLMAEAILACDAPVAQADSNPERIALVDEALRLLPPTDSALRVRLLGRAAWAHYYDRDGGQERRRLSAEGLAAARRLQDPGVLATALAERHRALMAPDDPDERLALATEMVSLARAHHSPELRAAGLQALAWDLAERGRMTEADEAMEAYGEIADHTQHSMYLWMHLLWRSMRALLRGDWDEAADLRQRVFDFGKSMDEAFATLSSGSQYLSMEVMRGRLDGLAPQLEAMIPVFPNLSAVPAALAYVRAQEGRAGEVRRIAEACFADGLEALAWDTTWMPTVGFVASAYATIGDVRACSWLYEQVRKYADRVALLGLNAAVCYGSGARTVAALATAIERWGEADDYFEYAASVNRKIGARPWLAYTLGEHARMLARRGRTRDRRRAEARRAEATALANSLGIDLRYVIGMETV